MSYKKITPLTVVTKGKISYIDQNHFLYQAVNIFFSAVKLGILTWEVYGTDSLLEPASSGQSMNYSFNHFRVGFKRGRGRLPLGSELFRNNWFTKVSELHEAVLQKRPSLLFGSFT